MLVSTREKLRWRKIECDILLFVDDLPQKPSILQHVEGYYMISKPFRKCEVVDVACTEKMSEE